jgi:glucosyl-3-phosphoglycerate synthase
VRRPSVSVCIPARDEAATVGLIVKELGGLDLHEVLVVDDHSTDGTAEVATAAGARVVRVEDVLPECGPGEGKGEALWKSVAASTGDIIVWLDADLEDFDPGVVTRLVEPLDDPAIALVKGRAERPLHGRPGEGGRVTELTARPVLSLLFPALARLAQPLAGELAARRSLLERLPFAAGYGVDLGLLLDASRLVGVDAFAEVDLGVRVHRNRPLSELAVQARTVLAVALHRAGVPGVELPPGRPPLVDVPGYRRSAG